jgi:hypothetical protein
VRVGDVAVGVVSSQAGGKNNRQSNTAEAVSEAACTDTAI